MLCGILNVVLQNKNGLDVWLLVFWFIVDFFLCISYYFLDELYYTWFD